MPGNPNRPSRVMSVPFRRRRKLTLFHPREGNPLWHRGRASEVLRISAFERLKWARPLPPAFVVHRLVCAAFGHFTQGNGQLTPGNGQKKMPMYDSAWENATRLNLLKEISIFCFLPQLKEFRNITFVENQGKLNV